MTTKELETMVKKHVAELGEYCKSVKIFVTVEHPDDETISRSYNSGCGEWFASYGQIQAWLIEQDEIIRCDARKAEDSRL